MNMNFIANPTFPNVILFLLSFTKGDTEINGYVYWESHPRRNDLYIPPHCENKNCLEQTSVQYVSYCCRCFTIPKWMIPPYWSVNTSVALDIEYLDPTGISKILWRRGNFVSDYISLVHINGYLSLIPENTCKFQNIGYVDLSYNQIILIQNINCLYHLDTLILKGNKLTKIQVSSFTGLSLLRVLDISNNSVQHMEAGFLSNRNITLLHLNVTYNLLEVLDLSNLIQKRMFCMYDFGHNRINKITNILDIKIDKDSYFEQGDAIILTHNNFSYFPSKSDMGMKDETFIGKWTYALDLSYNDWICDCRLYDFLSVFDLALPKFQSVALNCSCKYPSELENMTVYELRKNKDRLICNLTLCPNPCHCSYHPHENRTFVNCSSRGLTKVPYLLLPDNNLEIDLSNNSISDTEVKWKPYYNGTKLEKTFYSRTKTINFSNNNIQQLVDKTIYELGNATFIDFRYNSLHLIPRAVQTISLCYILLGKISLACSCSDLWLKTWLTSGMRSCTNNSIIYCKTKKGIMSMIDTTREILVCDPREKNMIPTIVVGVCTLVVLMCICLVFILRHEIFVLTHELPFIIGKRKAIICPELLYDVYISFDEEDENLRKWVKNRLIPFLENRLYKTFLFFRDSEAGKAYEDEIRDKIQKSANYIIVISEEYFSHERGIPHFLEWKYAFHQYAIHYSRKLIILNYDLLETEQLHNGYLRAFVRLGRDLDFSNKEKNLMKRIINRLGDPMTRTDTETIYTRFPNIINFFPERKETQKKARFQFK